MDWHFDNTYAAQLPWLAVAIAPVRVREPHLLALNEPLARELRLDPGQLRGDDAAAIFAGNTLPAGAQPVAQAYSGHQFGQFSPLLGDGRAHLLGEIVDVHGVRRDIALKGSGRTPFSRRGDGRAVLGPVLREFVVSEAMQALGVPTTRSLAAVTTGEAVLREGPLPGAVLTRVAASHLRVGTIELVRTQGSREQLGELAEFVRLRHYPELPPGDPFALLSAVVRRQADLVAAWMSIGFVHGVMNTDNMTLSGETIDYGPCAFLDAYDPDAVFSSIDTGGRYRYRAQPGIAAWNLARLAEALLPLADGEPETLVAEATGRVNGFFPRYAATLLTRFRAKLGVPEAVAPDAVAEPLVDDLLEILAAERLDLTGTFRALGRVVRGDRDAVRGEVGDLARYDAWEQRWLALLPQDPGERAALAVALDGANAAYLPRNHLVEQALAAATAGDLGPFEELLAVVRDPFTERPGLERYAEPGPDGFSDDYVTFCGT